MKKVKSCFPIWFWSFAAIVAVQGVLVLLFGFQLGAIPVSLFIVFVPAKLSKKRKQENEEIRCQQFDEDRKKRLESYRMAPHVVVTSEQTVVCLQCGKKQSAARNVCMDCGAALPKDEANQPS